jgi:NADPH-dependent 2,4-dienoyl-CoA reductase/sulfur reductase-like enzyme
MSDTFDLAIVGAGPAGMAAATLARELGLSTVVLDEQGEPGGQIYRAVERVAETRAGDLAILGKEYAYGASIARAFRASGAVYRPSMMVWQIDGERKLYASGPKGSEVVAAKRIIIATGAMERPVPLPGWTLPGVMGCGAAQVAYKTAGIVPDGRVFVVGQGPLLLLITQQLMKAGVKVEAVLQTTTYGRYLAAMPQLPAFAMAPGYMAKGLQMLRDIKGAGIPILHGVSDVKLHGTDRVREIEYTAGGRTVRAPADIVLLHEGVVPNANLWMAAGCAQEWDKAQRCFRPTLDRFGASSVDGILVAGDAGGIGGAIAAEYRGRLAALAAAQQTGRIDAAECERRSGPVRSALSSNLRSRPYLDVLYRPAQHTVAPPDADTIVCRCEEVKAGLVRALVRDQGCPGPNQMKTFVRCGMGPCQGRMCGLTVVELIAETRGISPGEVGYYRIRPPVKPVTLGEIAALEDVTPA